MFLFKQRQSATSSAPDYAWDLQSSVVDKVGCKATKTSY